MRQFNQIIAHQFGLGKFFWAYRHAHLTLRELTEQAARRKGGRLHGFTPPPRKPGERPEHFPDYLVAELTPGKVIGDALLVGDDEDAVANDTQMLGGQAQPAGHWVLRRFRYRREQRLAGTTLLLAASAGHNYYHWLFDSLPRLHLLERAGLSWKSMDRLLLNEVQLPFHQQSLELLGIPVSRQMRCHKARVLRCERLIVPSLACIPCHPNAWVCDFLRQTFLPSSGFGGSGRRLFISRSRARGRRLVNEAELLPWLAQERFEVCNLEDLTFTQQIERFASASIILAIHGAGLTNLVFASPGARVIEICPPTFGPTCFEDMCALLDLRFSRIVGELVPSPKKRIDLDDVRVSVEALKSGLQGLLVSV